MHEEKAGAAGWLEDDEEGARRPSSSVRKQASSEASAKSAKGAKVATEREEESIPALEHARCHGIAMHEMPQKKRSRGPAAPGVRFAPRPCCQPGVTERCGSGVTASRPGGTVGDSRALSNIEGEFPELAPEPYEPGSPVLIVVDRAAAAWMLVPKRWELMTKKVKGDLFASIPNAQTILFAGGAEKTHVEGLRKLTEKLESSESHPVSRTLLRWTQAGWVETK